MQSVQLSKADCKVLAQVFDPESAPERTEVLVDPSLPSDRHIHDAELLATLRKRESEAIKLIEAHEKSSPQSPNTKDKTFHAALALLDTLISEQPSYASARNNRAQLRRWRYGDRHLLCRGRNATGDAPSRREAAAAVVQDLQTSISLASPARPTDAVAPAQGRVLAQAYTQLGAVLHVAGKDLAEIQQLQSDAVSDEEQREEVSMETPPEPFATWNQTSQFEEEASRLFYLGGLYGNEVAKALAVHTNPHAKLCGNIVQEAMRKEMAMG